MIENKDSLPKYYAISQDIITSIKSGKLTPGMKVPSEREIIETYGVSNTTARKALAETEKLGWAKRIKGKGTFVQSSNVTRSVSKILSFTKNMIQADLIPHTRILYQGTIRKGYSSVINGRRYSMNGPVYKIHRLRFGDDIPMLLEVRYINLKLCPGIGKMDLSDSLYKIYEEIYGLHLMEVRQMLSTILLDDSTKEFFNVTEPTPGILVDGVTFCGKEIILSIEKSIYRGDKYKFAVTATS